MLSFVRAASTQVRDPVTDRHGPYEEGWPKTLSDLGDEDGAVEVIDGPKLRILGSLEVVPLSDAERMREALGHLYDQCAEGYFRRVIRAALNPKLTP